MQTNKDIALLLWQGMEQVRLHSAFIEELKNTCITSLARERPINIEGLINRLVKLQDECDQVLQRTAIPVEEKSDS